MDGNDKNTEGVRFLIGRKKRLNVESPKQIINNVTNNAIACCSFVHYVI